MSEAAAAYNDSDGNDALPAECTICTDYLSAHGGEDVWATDCGHVFHGKCIKKWLQVSGRRQ